MTSFIIILVFGCLVLGAVYLLNKRSNTSNSSSSNDKPTIGGSVQNDILDSDRNNQELL